MAVESLIYSSAFGYSESCVCLRRLEHLRVEVALVLGAEHWAVIALDEAQLDRDLQSCLEAGREGGSDGEGADGPHIGAELDDQVCERLWRTMRRLWAWYATQRCASGSEIKIAPRQRTRDCISAVVKSFNRPLPRLTRRPALC